MAELKAPMPRIESIPAMPRGPDVGPRPGPAFAADLETRMGGAKPRGVLEDLSNGNALPGPKIDINAPITAEGSNMAGVRSAVPGLENTGAPREEQIQTGTLTSREGTLTSGEQKAFGKNNEPTLSGNPDKPPALSPDAPLPSPETRIASTTEVGELADAKSSDELKTEGTDQGDEKKSRAYRVGKLMAKGRGKIDEKFPQHAERRNARQEARAEKIAGWKDQEGKSEETKSAEAEVEKRNQIDEFVTGEMKTWDNENPPPDANNETEMNAWLDKRAEKQGESKSQANISAEMKGWLKDNPMPDREKDPKAFNEWNEKRAEKLKDTKDKQEQKKKDEKEGTRELSAKEIQEKVMKIKNLSEQIGNLENGIHGLTIKAGKTSEDQLKLNDYKVKRDIAKNEVKQLTQDLQNEAATATSPVKKIAIVTAIIMAFAAAAVGQAAH